MNSKKKQGYGQKKIKQIGTFNLASGHHTQVCHVFVATGLTQGEHGREKDELLADMKTKKITLTQLEKSIISGKIKDGPSIAAFTLFKLKKNTI